MPSTSTPTKRRKATRLLTSSTSKSSVTLINALAPLLLLRLSWKSLLQDPTTTTLTTPLLPSIFIIQSAFIILLLPFNPSSKPAKKRVVKIDTLGEALRSKAMSLTRSLFLLIPATLAFYTIIVLFGAPLTTHTLETLLTAAHIAILSTYPLSSSLTTSLETVRQLITLEYTTDVDVLKWTYWGGIGTVLGAWLGAVPIPLDWDRDWQKWPITIVVGAYIGHAIGLVLGVAWTGLGKKGPKSVANLEGIEEEKKTL